MSDDHESTTVILKRLAPGLAWLPRVFRERLTPAALWVALSALAGAAWWLIGAYHDIRTLETTVVELKQERDLLHKIDTQMAVLDTKIDNIVTKVDRQEEWREKIEGIAEAPPHRKRQ